MGVGGGCVIVKTGSSVVVIGEGGGEGNGVEGSEVSARRARRQMGGGAVGGVWGLAEVHGINSGFDREMPLNANLNRLIFAIFLR